MGAWKGFSLLATCKTAALNNTLLKPGVRKSRNDLEWGLQVHVLKRYLFFAAYAGKYSVGSVNILLAGPVKGGFPGCSSLMIGDRRNQHKLKRMRCHLIILAKSLDKPILLAKQSCTNSGNESEIIQKARCNNNFYGDIVSICTRCPFFVFIVTLVVTIWVCADILFWLLKSSTQCCYQDFRSQYSS